MDKNRMLVYWKQEENLFIVEVPELSEHVVDDLTYSEAVRKAEDALDEWIKTIHEDQRYTFPFPKGSLGNA
jgi:predicted RNase H-like HicB family nuclease